MSESPEHHSGDQISLDREGRVISIDYPAEVSRQGMDDLVDRLQDLLEPLEGRLWAVRTDRRQNRLERADVSDDLAQIWTVTQQLGCRHVATVYEDSFRARAHRSGLVLAGVDFSDVELRQFVDIQQASNWLLDLGYFDGQIDSALVIDEPVVDVSLDGRIVTWAPRGHLTVRRIEAAEAQLLQLAQDLGSGWGLLNDLGAFRSETAAAQHSNDLVLDAAIDNGLRRHASLVSDMALAAYANESNRRNATTSLQRQAEFAVFEDRSLALDWLNSDSRR